MNKSKPLTTSTSSSKAQASTQPKDAARRGRINIQMVQNVLLIWLDSNIDNNSSDCRNTIMQLRRAVNSINTFTDSDQCIQFLEDMDKEKACMIISGSLGQKIVPQVHNMSQVDSIFIFCGNKKYHEQWAKEWTKIKGIFTEITLICEALKKAAQECEHNAMSISIMTAGDGSKKNLDQLDPSFMYMQILKEILLTIDFEQKHFKQYIEYCREIFVENDDELKNIKKFEREYRDKTPIWWYTLESFLYPMLNRGLRQMDVDIIIKMGFFIKDLHRHIGQLHKEQFDSTSSGKQLRVYRGQGMKKNEFEQMKKSKGGLISFNNFLSTSRDQSVSLNFAYRALTNPATVGVLFVIHINPSQSTTPFAAIANVSAIRSENEILFAMQTIFRIGNITSMSENGRLVQVELTLTSNDDKDIRQLTEYIQQASFPESEGWYRLGSVLYKMGQFDKAEGVYQILLGQATNEREKAPIYNQLALAKDKQGQYKEAITMYEKAVKIYEKNPSSKNASLASVYNNIGGTYRSISEYSKALSYYEKSLEIKQQSFPSNHPGLAASYNNIGAVYQNMNEYSKALSYYEKSLEIQQQSLPSNHPDLGVSYNNIGLLYEQIGKYSKAFTYYQRAVQNAQQSLPSDHPTLKQRQKRLENIKKKLS